jgi:hypothetical protein
VRSFLGLDQAAGGAQEKSAVCKLGDDQPQAADLLVLDDAGLGFREAENCWPAAVARGKAKWILVKMASPVAQGALWERLTRESGEYLVVMTANALRRTQVHISRELSWERTAIARSSGRSSASRR